MVKITGIEALQGKLKRSADLGLVKKTVKLNGGELENTMKRNATFVKGYQTGTTKRSIKLDMEDGGFTAKVAPHTHYSPYLEYGTRKMEAQPFVKPSHSTQEKKFISDMQRLMR